MTDEKPNFAEYHRQGMACLTLARLSDVPDIQHRWTMIAQTWFRLAEMTTDPEPQETKPSNIVSLRWGS